MPLLKRWMVLLPCLALAACASHPPAPTHALTAPPPAPKDADTPLLVRDGDKILTIERQRPLKPGDQYDVDGHSVFDIKVDLPAVLKLLVTKGSRLESGEKVYDISGRVLVNALDPAGKPSAFTFTVKNCTGEGEELLPAGCVVDAKASTGGMNYTRRDGKKIPREVSQALLGIFNQEKGAGAPPKGKDGSDVPHSIGDTWPVEIPADTTRAVGEGSKIHFTDMHAWTTLTAMKVIAGVQAVEVESGMKAELQFDALPFGFKAKPAPISAKQTMLYPVDPALPPLKAQRELEAGISVEGSFLLMPVSADIKVQMHQTITPVTQGQAAVAQGR